MSADADPARPVDRLIGRISRGGAALGVAVLFACAVVTVVDVVGRRTVGWSLPGLIDLTQWLIMISMFLCIPYAFRKRAHVDVDLIHRRLPGSLQRGLDVLWSLLSAGFLVAIVWHAGKAAMQTLEYGEASPTLAMPMVAYWVPILVGAALSAIICIGQVARPPEPTAAAAVTNATTDQP